MRIKWLAAPLALTLLLGACGGGDDNDGADASPDTDGGESASADGDAEPVTLSMWVFNGMGFDDMVARYQDENPHVTIEMQQTEHADHHEALINALAAGGGPDVAAIEVAFIQEMAQQSQVWTNLYDHGAEEVEDRYVDWKIDQAKSVDGESLIGLPTDIGGMAIAYRWDLFEEAGLPHERDEVSAAWVDSWDDYIAFGEDYTEATGNAFYDNEELLWQAVVNQSPDTYFDENGDPYFEESEQVQYAWDTVNQAIDAGIGANIAAWSEEWNAGMSNGDFAVLTAPAWMMGYIQDNAPDQAGNWDIAEVPEAGGNWGGSHLGIPAASENADEAYAFIEWLLNEEQQLEAFRENGNFPSIPALFDSPDIQEFSNPYFNDAPVGPIYADNAERVVAQNTGPNYNSINSEFQDGLGRVADGAQEPDEAWDQAIAEIRSLLG
jgi:cellobiose transport system substrate-binding protein